MVRISVLAQYLNDLLSVGAFRDYCPNGLQVGGRDEIKRLVTGVTACQPLITEASACQADALLVHHGYFWRGEAQAIVGMKRERIAALLRADMNLLAYHLPLDAHPTLGNNAQLAKVLGIRQKGTLPGAGDPSLVAYGELDKGQEGEAFAQHLASCLGQKPLHIPGKSGQVKTIAWCTGGGQDFIDVAIESGVDAFITGEVSERTFHSAMELGIHFYACGHHATERYGVQALGALLAKKFDLEHTFIEIPNPV